MLATLETRSKSVSCLSCGAFVVLVDATYDGSIGFPSGYVVTASHEEDAERSVSYSFPGGSQGLREALDKAGELTRIIALAQTI